MANNRICGLLGIRYPIIQALMNWVSRADLAAAASNAGGNQNFQPIQEAPGKLDIWPSKSTRKGSIAGRSRFA